MRRGESKEQKQARPGLIELYTRASRAAIDDENKKRQNSAAVQVGRGRSSN
jgi:hypothetical protein